MVRFVFEAEPIERDAQGRATVLPVRFVRTESNQSLDEDEILDSLVGTLRQQLVQEFRPIYGRVPTRDLLARIRFHLRVYDNATGRYNTSPNWSGTDLLPSQDLSVVQRPGKRRRVLQMQGYRKIYEFLEQIRESSETLEVANLDWSMFILPQSFVSGRGKTLLVARRKYPENIYKLAYDEHEDDQGPIACLAFALIHRIHKRSTLQVTKQKARALQQELNWQQEVGLLQVDEFVKKYPEYRVTILTLGAQKHFANQTFEGRQFDTEELNQPNRRQSKVLYIGLENQHYFPVASPQQYARKMFNTESWQFCHTCVKYYDHQVGHSCDPTQPAERKPRVKKCPHCSKSHVGRCECNMAQCNQCNSVWNRDHGHRCLVMKSEEKRKDKTSFTATDSNGQLYALWAYDLEACIERRVTIHEERTFVEDEEGYFTGETEFHQLYEVNGQKCNLVVAQNVYSGEQKVWFGETCLDDFLAFMATYNRGKNVCVAHNAAKYDSRLVFEAAVQKDYVIKNLMVRGAKIMRMEVGSVLFQDSLLHLPGALRRLAKEFCRDVHLEKGYFPHLFNTISHYDYEGPIPDKSTFDLRFVIGDEQELASFYEWYDTWAGRTDWNFMNELKKYCINDVQVLANVMKAYADIAMEDTGYNPWFSVTGPSFSQDAMVRDMTRTYDLPDKSDHEDYFNRIQEIACNEGWAVLYDEEYDFVRQALHGGRTEVRCAYHHITDEAYQSGEMIVYQDIVSMYPYQQIEHDFPVGVPTVYLWGATAPTNPRISVASPRPEVTAEELINDPSWYGFICCTIQPPDNIYWPVLGVYDEVKKKYVFSCDLIRKTVFTSIEVREALLHGYTLIKVHRFDKYNKRESLYANYTKKQYLQKMINSKNLPSPEEQARLKQVYDDKFDMGDMLQKTFDENKWCKNPARKAVAKQFVNSGWGKNAQKPVMVESSIMDINADQDQLLLLNQNISLGNTKLKNIVSFGDRHLYQTENSEKISKNVHSSYLPAAVFVPAYARLQLWRELNKLGKRALMCDTDSIVYVYKPNEYNIPEGDVLGEWEREDFDKLNGGIREFVGVGPKSYAMKCHNGETSIKAKGVSLKLAHKKLLNFQVMKQVVLDYLQSQVSTQINVPQKTFVFNWGKGMHTHNAIKKFSFHPTDLKGVLDSDGYVYPFGFNKQ
jgi:hypothetical protein